MPLMTSASTPPPLTPVAPKLIALMALTLLGACSSVHRPLQSNPNINAVTPAAGGEITENRAAVQVPPKLARLSPNALPWPTTPNPSSYATRDDARKLALKLAAKYQVDETWALSVLAQAHTNDTVTRLIMPAASSTAKNWAAYKNRFIEPTRIRAGAAFWRTHEAALRRAQTTYGVPMDVIIGVIGVETIYGRNTGNISVLDALTTLSLDFPKGRSDRSAFFQDELGQFLRLCAEQGDDPTTVLGSYAGAIGWPQFMPSSIRRLAVDFDGDGRIDLRNNPVDAIGSVANYLARSGWKTGVPTHFAVRPPSNETALSKLLAPDILPTFSPHEFQDQGAVLDDAGLHYSGLLALVMLNNADASPTYVAATENFYAITRYNQSSYYALAVIELGRAVAQALHGQDSGT